MVDDNVIDTADETIGPLRIVRVDSNRFCTLYSRFW